MHLSPDQKRRIQQVAALITESEHSDGTLTNVHKSLNTAFDHVRAERLIEARSVAEAVQLFCDELDERREEQFSDASGTVREVVNLLEQSTDQHRVAAEHLVDVIDALEAGDDSQAALRFEDATLMQSVAVDLSDQLKDRLEGI